MGKRQGMGKVTKPAKDKGNNADADFVEGDNRDSNIGTNTR